MTLNIFDQTIDAAEDSFISALPVEIIFPGVF
jgi:hypothetical protein